MFISESIKYRFFGNVTVVTVSLLAAAIIYVLDDTGDFPRLWGSLLAGFVAGGCVIVAATMPAACIDKEIPFAMTVAHMALSSMIWTGAVIYVFALNPNIFADIGVSLIAFSWTWLMSSSQNSGDDSSKQTWVMMPFGVGLVAALFMLKKREEETV